MKNRENSWGETHPIAYGLIMIAVVMLIARIAEAFIEALASGVAAMAIYGTASKDVVGNMGLVSAEISLVSNIVILLLFWFVFRKELHNFFNVRKFNEVFFLGWSALAIDAFTLIAGILSHKSYGNLGAALLIGMQPGFSEEIMYRIIPICLAMRSKERKKVVVPVIVITSILFGLRHGLNIMYGADPVTTLFQVLYATGTGFLFAGIYVRTGNIWITIFLHSLTDTIYYLGLEAQTSGGVLTQGTNFSDAIILLIYAALYFVNAYFVFAKCKQVKIPDIWSEIWREKVETREAK